MDMSKLQALESRIQIISIIDKGTLYGGDIWQSEPGHNHGRHVSQVIQIQNETKFEKIILRTPTFVQINPERPIFVRLNYRNIIFKIYPGQFKISGDKITCDYPREIRALEERKGGDRYVLPFNAEISLSVKRLERSVREMTYNMELRIIDISQRGFGILISSHNREYFKKGDHFWLHAVDHTELQSPILGAVCYVAPKGYYLKRGDVRVGLSLAMPMSREIFERLTRKCQIILSA